MQSRRKDDAADQQAHVRKRVQESGPRARRRTDDRALRPEGASHRRGDDLAAPRELHRERRGRDRVRGDRTDGRGPAARARPVRSRARARGGAPRRARTAAGEHACPSPAGPRRVRGEAKLAWPRAARARLRRRRRGIARPCSSGGRARRSSRSRHGRVLGARETGDLRPRSDRGRRRAAATAARSGRRSAATWGRASSASIGPTPPAASPRCRGRRRRFDRDFPHTLRVRVRLERPVAVLRRGPDAWLVSVLGARARAPRSGRIRDCRGSGCRAGPTSR